MEAARHDLDVSEKRRALELLDRADQSHPMVHPMRALLRTLEAIPNPEPPWVTRRALALRDWYFGLVARPRFARFVGWVFALWALGSLTQILSLLEGRHVSFVHVASLCSSAVAGALVAAGALKLRSGDRAAAYRRFDRALLVSIFVTQIFAFVESQFAAAFGLGIDILLLVTLRAMMRGERHLKRLDTASPASASAPAGAPAPASPAPALQPPARGPAPPRR
jgi:hypothetical protein